MFERVSQEAIRTTLIAVRLSSRELEAVRRAAKARKLTVSDLLRAALRRELKEAP